MSKVVGSLKYRQAAPLVVEGPDLAPDRPQDVCTFVAERGWGTPYGLLFSQGRIHRQSVFLEPSPPGALSRLRVALTSLIKTKARIDRDVILFANRYYRNYYHFVVEGLPRIFLVKDYLDDPETVIACPDDVQSFHKQWFAFLGIADRIVYLPNSQVVVGRHMVASSFSAPGDNHHRDVLRDFRAWLWSIVSQQDRASHGSGPANRKYLIGRKPGLRRAIVNLPEVQAICARHGYDYVELDDMSLTQQCAVFHDASEIVAIHGAGLANLLFCREGTRVLELRSREFHNRTFEKMSDCLGLAHRTLNCEPATFGDDMATRNHSDVIVDGGALEAMLAR